MYTINNGTLVVSIASMGAELQSIVNTKTGLEYLWDANPKFWPKKSPALFPVVGGLQDNSYQFDGTTYHLNRHGFARETEFEVGPQTDSSITFVLASSENTLKLYPFHFKFSVTYALLENTLQVTYLVENTGSSTMYFSVGAHPAFNVPLVEGGDFAQYYLAFNEVENAGVYPIASDGLIETLPVPYLKNTNKLPLTKEMFYKDALIFKDLKSTSISILSHQHDHGLTVSYPGFPYMGIWAAKDADFVCIEPWYGLGDTKATTGILQEKEGIMALAANTSFDGTWTVTLF
ncbi:aldose 1-epimerase family protein [Parasediminibacterium sp. JCM 36343]|uniref:aldose 1-epimerase family protein n=1 Tax=Parasediminibacterium sp. JCM 36343 TaxID=3374279 RepID=UPI00397B8060